MPEELELLPELPLLVEELLEELLDEVLPEEELPEDELPEELLELPLAVVEELPVVVLVLLLLLAETEGLAAGVAAAEALAVAAGAGLLLPADPVEVVPLEAVLEVASGAAPVLKPLLMVALVPAA